MVKVKVTDKLMYNIEGLNRDIVLSADIPRFIITPEEDEGY